MNEPPIDHILGVLAKLDDTAVAPGAGTPPEATFHHHPSWIHRGTHDS